MRVVLLRVGVDMGEGRIIGPLFTDGGFEFVPIPDSRGLDDRTYGNVRGRCGRLLVEYFPDRLRPERNVQSMHVDPEFETFTYGDPDASKATPPRVAVRRRARFLRRAASLAGQRNPSRALYRRILRGGCRWRCAHLL